ncbi:hypothetical protein BVRB_007890 [Beta vulgaris subsp. vulgaris]|uniref:Uncharacterized protein n=1 Tax=Beta vulgaris subsp. vulgaris TaxID=3555 RepID=A0A0J8B6Q8_BETVV|nr:hypothetical protein BVRB_007890 [Beta vulgaris subsp. vulgaris]
MKTNKKTDKEGEKEKKRLLVEPIVDLKPKKPMDEAEEEDEAENSISLSNFRISKPLKDTLISNEIQALFHIQVMTFNIVIDGYDLFAHAQIGQGSVFAELLGFRVQDVLVRIAVLLLVRDKVKSATGCPDDVLFADDILMRYPTLKGARVWKR